MRTSIPRNNFSSGQIDRDLKGRFDIPIYQNGHEISENFCQTIKGTAFYRSGYEFIDEIGNAALYEFKFNQEQSYLLVFRIQYIEFFTYDSSGEFVRVLDDEGNALTLVHPYGTEIFNLCISQNCDVMYIQHTNGEYPEYQLKRTAANKFELVLTEYKFKSGEQSLSSNTADEAHGFPLSGTFYESRYLRASSSKYFTYLYGSKGGDYNNITKGTETNDGFQFDLAEALSKALWVISGANSLLIGTAEGILTVNGGSVSSAITPTSITAKMSSSDGCSPVKPLRKDNFVFYISANGRKMYLFEYDVLVEQFKATNLSKANYEITKGGIKKLAYKEDRFGFIYAICDGNLLQICFSADEGVNAWSIHKTKGEVVDICSVTKPDGDSDLFLNIKRNINGVDRFYLERLSDWVEFPRREDFVSDYGEAAEAQKLEQKELDDEAFYRMVAEAMREANHLDCSIKYSGYQKNKITFDKNKRNYVAEKPIFKQTDIGRRIVIKTKTGREYGWIDIRNVKSETEIVGIWCGNDKEQIKEFDEWYFSATVFEGLEHLEGETVAVVGNGGYIGDFKVENGKVDISSANTNRVETAIIGLKYKGILKSPNLGLQLQGAQTFTKKKNIYSITLDLSFSSGGKVGTSLYNLEKVQKFNPEGLYDLPALPMDSEVKVKISDTYDREKHYYIVQDEPLPFRIAMIVPEYKHVL